jgi:hypothetical protein
MQDHKFTTVSILGVTDPEGDAVTLSVTGITQDEGVKASDSGISGTWACPDGKKTATAGQVQLANECLNAKSTAVNGRVYSLQFTATDSKGASCTGSVKVCAKPGTAGSCVDEGQTFNSMVCA